MKCRQCSGDVEPIKRAGEIAFLFCRKCKLPHDESGRPTFSSRELNSHFNPLRLARDTIKATHPDTGNVARSALEVALVMSLQEAYLGGLKDGVLLAYSQDVEEGLPYDRTIQGTENNTGKG